MEQHRSPTRRLRIFLRDFRLVEATVSLAEGQSLASFFAHRRHYVNLREAFWPGTGERVNYVVLKVSQVLWAASVDGDIPLAHTSAPSTGRLFELHLDGGLLVRARLMISPQQRMIDYLEAAAPFLPIMAAQLLRSGRPPKRVNVHLGDIVLNQEGIQAGWETVSETGAPPRRETTSELMAVPGMPITEPTGEHAHRPEPQAEMSTGSPDVAKEPERTPPPDWFDTAREHAPERSAGDDEMSRW